MLRFIVLVFIAPVYFAYLNLRYHLEQTALISMAISLLALWNPIFLPLYLIWGFLLVRLGAIPGTTVRTAVFYPQKVSKLKLIKPHKNLKLTVFQTGKIETGSWGVYEGASKPIVMDQPAFLITHPKGNILFETGIHPHVSLDPVGYVGPLLYYGGFLKMQQTNGQDIGSQLKKHKVLINKIKTVYISHLHPEHGGAAEIFDKTKIAVDKTEFDYAMGSPKYNYFKKEYENIKNWELLEFGDKPKLDPFGGMIDIFSDGSVFVVSTPGHTPGSISMLINLPEGPVFLVGDVAWRLENITTATIGMPFVSVDSNDHKIALGKLIAFVKANKEVTIVPTHDLTNLRQSGRTDVEIVK